MAIELTTKQLHELDAEQRKPAEVVDPRGRRRYFLIPVEEYEALQDARDQALLRQVSLTNLAGRLVEDA